MTDAEQTDHPRLANPYAQSAARPAVWGVTLGGFGAAAAGVLAVTMPVSTVDEMPSTVAVEQRLAGTTEIVIGESVAVDVEVQALCMPGGYLLPCEQPAHNGSPALL